MLPNAQEINRKRKGSGTGLLTEVFLKNGHRVFGVEPDFGRERRFWWDLRCRETGKWFIEILPLSNISGTIMPKVIGNAEGDE